MSEQKIEDLLEENKKLKAEIKEAYEILYPAGLVNGKGEEIPTNLIDRAKMAVMIMNSEADFADEMQKEASEIRQAIAWYVRCDEHWLDAQDYANEIENLTVDEIYKKYPRQK